FRRLKHPNVLLLMGACVNSLNQICIITEFASRLFSSFISLTFTSRGDMRCVLQEVRNLKDRLNMAKQMASGLYWMHVHRIVHRDLKFANFLVFEDFTIKVAHVLMLLHYY